MANYLTIREIANRAVKVEDEGFDLVVGNDNIVIVDFLRNPVLTVPITDKRKVIISYLPFECYNDKDMDDEDYDADYDDYIEKVECGEIPLCVFLGGYTIIISG